jgi:hypothetical protein
MLYGLPPPNTYETVTEMQKIFVDKEKLLEQKYVDILDNIAIKYYKGYEHEKVKEVSGKEVDKLLKDVEDYMKRLKDLRVQIEKRTQEKTIEQFYQDVFQLLEGIFGKKPQNTLIDDFNESFIKKGRLPENYLTILKDIVRAREMFKKGKMAKHEIEDARKNASMLISHLIDFNQRCELVNISKGRMRIRTKDKTYELVMAGGEAFLIDEGNVSKITGRLENSSPEELTKALSKQEKTIEIKLDGKVFEVLKKHLGDFTIVM